MFGEPILSRHRLPHPYRLLLTVFWAMPGVMLFIVVAAANGFSLDALDPRLLLPVLLMGLPACYIWQEGVDVTARGIIARVHIPRCYDYGMLQSWAYDRRPERRILTVWDQQNSKVLECRAGHLTDLPILLHALKDNLHSRL